MGQIATVRLPGLTLLIPLLLLGGGCKREVPDGARALTSSLIFDDASPEVREALATTLDFRINDDNFARWEKAQSNLEKLPRSAMPAMSAAGGSAVERGVARLESSPYTRTAIESAGLSVREFVLETIALAQATEAAHTGRSTSRAPIPPENFRFVQRYSSRALYFRSRVARADAGADDMTREVEVTSDEAETDRQLRLEQLEQQAEMRVTDQESRREELEHAAEMQREEREHAAEVHREASEHQSEKEPESILRRRRLQLAPSPDSARDSVRDTIPPPRC
ncbi:MAG: hypothetical protein M3P12_10695 [Gemmatimonadota bacterium]|nr:hypothetical protein [Gemmatimonadota bacterium]